MDKPWASNARQLLNLMNNEDIFQLGRTVCKGCLDFTSKNEAVQAIIAATDTPEELLRKKKVKREYLLRYIWKYWRQGGTSFSLPVKSDKQLLIREILTQWGCGKDEKELKKSSGPIINEVDSSDDEDIPSGSNSQSDVDQTPLILEFAEQFLAWFYGLLNYSDVDLDPRHFYGQCLFRLRCGTSVGQNATVETEGALNVAQCLRTFIVTQRLNFQPNLRQPRGFQAMEESHGAVLLKCNGTVHHRASDNSSQSNILGPFEQTFLVIEDPQDKTWKIQDTSLTINAEITLLAIDAK